VREIRAALDAEKDDKEKKFLKERLGKLVGGVGVIRVGGVTSTEVREKKDRIDDAVAATKAACEEGLLTGGGLSYIHGLLALGDLDERHLSPSVQAGVDVVRHALKAPLFTLAGNAGFNGKEVLINLVDVINEGSLEWASIGFDALTGKITDVLSQGIINPTKVDRVALQHAASIACQILLTGVVVSTIRKREL
jgi:chaperonin GroEL